MRGSAAEEVREQASLWYAVELPAARNAQKEEKLVQEFMLEMDVSNALEVVIALRRDARFRALLERGHTQRLELALPALTASQRARTQAPVASATPPTPTVVLHYRPTKLGPPRRLSPAPAAGVSSLALLYCYPL